MTHDNYVKISLSVYGVQDYVNDVHALSPALSIIIWF